MNNADSRMNAHLLFGIVSAAFALYLIFSLLLWQFEYFAPSLWLDMVYDAMAAARLGTVDYLFATHNEHIIATSRLLFIVDRWFGATGLVPVAAGYLLQCSVAAMLGVLAWRALAPADKASALAAVTLVFALTLNGSQLQVLTWGLMVQHTIMNAVTVGAALLTCRLLLAEQGGGLPGTEIALWCVTLVGLLTLGNGAAVPLTALVLALLYRAPMCWIAVFGVQGALVAAAYLVLRTQTAVDAGSTPLLPDPSVWGQHLGFAIAAVGGPLLRATPWPSVDPTWPHAYNVALVIGGVIALVALVQAYRVVTDRRGARTLPGLVGFYLLIFAFGTALAASWSRLSLLGAQEALSQRYAVFTCMAWVGAVLVLCQWLSTAQTRWAVRAFPLLALTLMLGIGAAQQREMRIFAQWSHHVWEANLAVLLAIDDRAFLNTLYPHHQVFGDYVAEVLEPAQAGVFHLLSVRHGQRLDLEPRDLPACGGALEVLVPVPHEDRVGALQAEGKPYRFSGYSYLMGKRLAIHDVVAVDPTGSLVGYARNTRDARVLPQEGGDVVAAHYFGFLRVTENTAVDFVARSPVGSCRLGTWEVLAEDA